MEDFKIFKVHFVPFNIDLISGVLWVLPIDGIVEEDNHIELYASDSREIQKENIEAVLDALISGNLLENYTVISEKIKNMNWNEEWEKRVKTIRISERITVKPSFREYEQKPDEIVIVIDPKMSFGTGDHQTTQLAATLLEKHMSGNESVLDVGSGTGILAIAAARLGAKRVIGIDNDEWCLLNGKENTGLNNLTDLVEIRHGEISDIKEEKFNVILANINKSVLLDIADDIKMRVTKPGKIILSGFYQKDIEDIKTAYETSEIKLSESADKDEWSALIFHST